MPRPSGLMNPTDNVPVVPSKVYTFLMTGGSSAQASDWTSTGSTAMANAAEAGIGLVRVTGMTTAGGAFLFTFNGYSTGAVVPSSGDFNSSTNCNPPVATGPSAFQITGASTGFSVAAFTSGYVIVEAWKK